MSSFVFNNIHPSEEGPYAQDIISKSQLIATIQVL